MKYFFFLLLFTNSFTYGQQYALKGMVTDRVTNAPLASASVFINNSSKGTITDASGHFILGGISSPSVELVISYTGYYTQSLLVKAENKDQPIAIKLEERKESLETVSILVPEKDGWKKWGNFFKESFLGRSDFAKQCTIENPKVLKFFNDHQHNALTAYSNGNLVIVNKALGYTIKYQLEDFKYDFKNKITTFSGFMVFNEMKTNSTRKKNRWQQARKEVYLGSVMHFMRALYKGNVAQEGFDVREKIRIYNDDTLFLKIYRPGNMPAVHIGSHTYKAVPGEPAPFKKEPLYVDLIDTQIFPIAESAKFDSAIMQQSWYFDHFIQVIYKNAQVKMDYLLGTGLPKYLKLNPISDASLVNEAPLMIMKDGSYIDPVNFITSGYWAWCKLAEMLPLDYPGS